MRTALLALLSLIPTAAYAGPFDQRPYGLTPLDVTLGASTIVIAGDVASVTPAQVAAGCDEAPLVCQSEAVGADLEALPNPAHTTSTVRYHLAEREHVTLAVFDRLGREVSSLVRDEEKTAGPRSSTLHVNDLPAGEYTVRLQLGHSCTETLITVTH